MTNLMESVSPQTWLARPGVLTHGHTAIVHGTIGMQGLITYYKIEHTIK